jgi:glycosyl hydrolase family 76/ricin-type beta-trefoil lectin protein
MKKIRIVAAACAAALAVAGGVYLNPGAQAETTLPAADAPFTAWNDSFLHKGSSTDTYYTDHVLTGTYKPSYFWNAALNIMIAQDAYERTHSPADRQLVSDLVTTWIKQNGTTWTSWNPWNDDIGWAGIAVLRGYQATGNPDWLKLVMDQWKKAYDRGWTASGGGGIFERMDPADYKCALSNDPMAMIAADLYQITGDRTYLTKAEEIYAWVRKTLVDTSTGQVHECLHFPAGKADGPTTLGKSDNAYNGGSFIEMADDLYRITGNTMYRDDAKRTADRFMAKKIISNNGRRNTSYQYWLFKGVSDFCTDVNACPQYDAWMRSNAAQAWSVRDNRNLTWNDWTKKTNEPDADSFEMNSMVGLFQVLPRTAASFSGTYAIRNVGSQLALSAPDKTTVTQTADTGDAGHSWTLVPQSNGYVQIKNAATNQVLAVSHASGKPGAPGAAILQRTATGLIPGDDQWLPIRNADGTYSFNNRNSRLALDNPAVSTKVGAQYDQAAPNDGNGQKFQLVSRSANGGTGKAPTAAPTTAPTASPTATAPTTTAPTTTAPTTAPPTTAPPAGVKRGVVKSGIAGKCLDLNGHNLTNGTPVELWTCNGSNAQVWSLEANGTVRQGGKCLDAYALGRANGTKLEIWDCNGGTNQVWEPHNGGYRNPASGRCVDDPHASTTDGTQLALYDCNGTGSQKWSLPAA